MCKLLDTLCPCIVLEWSMEPFRKLYSSDTVLHTPSNYSDFLDHQLLPHTLCYCPQLGKRIVRAWDLRNMVLEDFPNWLNGVTVFCATWPGSHVREGLSRWNTSLSSDVPGIGPDSTGLDYCSQFGHLFVLLSRTDHIIVAALLYSVLLFPCTQ